MPNFIEIPKDREVIEAHQFDGTIESAKAIVDWLNSFGNYNAILKYYTPSLTANSKVFLYINESTDDVQKFNYIVKRGFDVYIVSEETFLSQYQPHPEPDPEPEIDNTTKKQSTDSDTITEDPRLVDLLDQVDVLLDGIDCEENDTGIYDESGWWKTQDGAKFGKIKLRELKNLIKLHWQTNNRSQNPNFTFPS